MLGDLKNKPIFVFGSNLAGRHGKGAALVAMREYGAVRGVGSGLTGHSYAIPTKDANLQTLPLDFISYYVDKFLEHAKSNPNQWFLLTKIGCGLSGYNESQIAPMFKGVTNNVILPFDFGEYM